MAFEGRPEEGLGEQVGPVVGGADLANRNRAVGLRLANYGVSRSHPLGLFGNLSAMGPIEEYLSVREGHGGPNRWAIQLPEEDPQPKHGLDTLHGLVELANPRRIRGLGWRGAEA